MLTAANILAWLLASGVIVFVAYMYLSEGDE